jgi:hypothetical protein
VVVGQLADQVLPGHAHLARTGRVAVGQGAEGVLGARHVAANGGVDDLVHAQVLGHGPTLAVRGVVLDPVSG